MARQGSWSRRFAIGRTTVATVPDRHDGEHTRPGCTHRRTQRRGAACGRQRGDGQHDQHQVERQRLGDGEDTGRDQPDQPRGHASILFHDPSLWRWAPSCRDEVDELLHSSAAAAPPARRRSRPHARTRRHPSRGSPQPSRPAHAGLPVGALRGTTGQLCGFRGSEGLHGLPDVDVRVAEDEHVADGVTPATIRLSLEPGTRWSTSTPSRAPAVRAERRARRRRGRRCRRAARPRPPSMRRSSPQTRSTSAASCTPLDPDPAGAGDPCLRAPATAIGSPTPYDRGRWPS